jgi:hypothetical protein
MQNKFYSQINFNNSLKIQQHRRSLFIVELTQTLSYRQMTPNKNICNILKKQTKIRFGG